VLKGSSVSLIDATSAPAKMGPTHRLLWYRHHTIWTPFLDPFYQTHPHVLSLSDGDPELSVVDIIETFLKFEISTGSQHAIAGPCLCLLLVISFAFQVEEQDHCVIQIDGRPLAYAEICHIHRLCPSSRLSVVHVDIIAHIASGSKILGSIGKFVKINHIPYVHEKGKKESFAA
jgi:hypothetical protein